MTALYIGAGIIVLALLGYLLVALIKPEIFP
jgi:K+-transporting ATPase KdpF subunit